MWRGGLRYSLSVSAPFVWRCLNSYTITPFPHPPHRTGHADFPHPALGQDTCLCTRKVIRSSPEQQHGAVYPSVLRPSALHIRTICRASGHLYLINQWQRILPKFSTFIATTCTGHPSGWPLLCRDLIEAMPGRVGRGYSSERLLPRAELPFLGHGKPR
jgi:hypothetical protein